MSGRGPRPLAVAAIISVFCLAAGAVFVAKMRERTGGHLSLPLDDAYIYLQYGRRLAEGHFLSYTEGAAPSTGASSWAHMMLLSTAFLAGLDGENAIWASLALGAVYLGLSIWLVFRIVRALAAGPAAGWWAAGATAVLATNWTFVPTAFSGMETVLYAAAMLAVVLAASGSGRPPRWGFAAAALLSWVRPEGIVLGAAGIVVLLLLDRARAAPPPDAAPGPSPRRRLVAAAAAFAVLLAPVVIGWAVTGTPQTDTFAVKGILAVPEHAGRAAMIAAMPESWKRQFLWLFTNFRPAGKDPAIQAALVGALGLGSIAALAGAVRRRLAGVLLLAAFVALGIFVTSMSWWTQARYSTPYVPLVIACAAVGFAEIAALLRPRALKAAWAVLAALVWALFSLTPLTKSFLDGYSWDCENSHDQQRKVGDWLRENTPEGTIVAVNDAGAIAYFSRRPVIDMIGLVSHGWAPCVHERAGGVFEKLEALPPAERPAILAVYDEVFPNLLRTGLVDKLLFSAQLEHRTINLGALKVVCSTKWDRPVDRHVPLQTNAGERTVADRINVADLDSERAHKYRVQGRSASVLAELPSGSPDGPKVIEGGRIVSGAETFTAGVKPAHEVVIVARGVFDSDWDVPVFVNGVEAARLRAPARPGVWSECAAAISAAAVKVDRLAITIGVAPGSSAPPSPPRQVAYYWILQ